jgi:predicted nicotinamide N-methyase
MSGFPSDSLVRRLAPMAAVAGGGPIVAHQAPDLFALWLAWEEECGVACGPPFWAVAWPAARVLAGYLLSHPDAVSGRTVLDLGCGGGVAGIAAARAGAASVVANDVDPVALHIAASNARANEVILSPAVEDLTTTRRAQVDVVLVADMFYEKEPSAGMMGWLRASAAAGSTVLIADSGRPFSPAAGLVDVHAARVGVCAEVEGVADRLVRIRELPR